MKHKHHIIPKHEGGTDDPENIVYLSVQEHAEAHRKLYEKNGKIEDYLAWKGLSGIIGKEEIFKILMVENGRRNGINSKNKKIGIHNPEYIKSQEYREMCSENGKTVGKKMAESGHCKKVAPFGGGKNLGKKYWYNTEYGKETVSFGTPGDGWCEGINMTRVNLEFLRENSKNVKGSFWIKNENTGETRMVKNEEDIPEGFKKGRDFQTKNIIDLINTPKSILIDGVPQIEINHSLIIFNPSHLRWELIPKKNSKKIIKVSHNDYYGLIWIRDVIIEKHSLKAKKSGFDFNTSETIDECLTKLKCWREYIKLVKIVENKKIKKWRRERYLEKINSMEENYLFVESIRNKIIPVL